MAQSSITFLILGVTVALFMTNKVPVAIVATGVSLALWATGLLSLDEALSGFGSPTVLFIAGTFVVAEALETTGVTAWVGQQMLARGGTTRTRVLTVLMLTCALLTALITPNASVAALVPAAVVVAIRSKQPAGQVMMPLAFAAHAGAMLMLIGSPVNVLITEAAKDAGVGGFGFFEFALAGIPLLIGTIAIVMLLGPKLLPNSSAKEPLDDFSSLAATLIRDYRLDRGVALFDSSSGAVEVVIPPRSELIGRRAFRGMLMGQGSMQVLGIQRNGAELGPGEVDLAAGDALLLSASWEAISDQLPDDSVVVVDEPDAVRRQLVLLGTGAKESLAVLGLMVVLLATGAVPPAVASLLAAGSLILLRVVSIEEAYRAISWNTVVLVAGMIPLSTAMQSSGAAGKLADGLVSLVGDAGPYALLAGVFVLVGVLGQLISNTATALIVIPIAVSSALELGVSARPVLMSLNVVASAALLTPVATPANMMVMEPGGYRFGDYWKLGLPVMAWYAVISIGWVPLIWRF